MALRHRRPVQGSALAHHALGELHVDRLEPLTQRGEQVPALRQRFVQQGVKPFLWAQCKA
jgi:hypothetical protein